MLKIADTVSPAHTDTTLMAVEMVIARIGRAVTMIAVAAGVTTSANSSSVPTASTAIVTAMPSRTMKSTDSARTGTLGLGHLGVDRGEQQRAEDEYDRGGQQDQQRGEHQQLLVSDGQQVAEQNVGQRRRILVASELKNRPKPVARASTVPVATSRSWARLPNAPITSAPPTQNAPSPNPTGSPSSAAPVAPGSPMWASAWAANAVLRTMTK